MRILLPVDFSDCSVSAARLGIAIAGAHGAEITLYHASGLLEHAKIPPAVFAQLKEQRMADHTRELGELSAALGDAVDALGGVELIVRHAEPALGICQFAREREVDLIVIGSHGDDETFMLGSVSKRVARDAPCPVLVVRSDHEERFPDDGLFRRALVAVDYSKFSTRAVRLTAELTEPSSPLELVHVYHAPDYENVPELVTALGELRAEELESLQELASRVDIAPVRISARTEIGRAADQLLALIDDDRKIDLVVVGAHGRDDAIAMLGTVTDKILRVSSAPVLVVPDAALTD